MVQKSETFESSEAPAAIGPYSQAIAPKVTGRPVFLSGQIGLKAQADGKPTLVEGGVEAETRQIFTNIRAILEAVGLELSDVLDAIIILTDMGDYPKVNKIYAEEFGSHKPARAAYQAVDLPMGAKVEIKATAWQPTYNT